MELFSEHSGVAHYINPPTGTSGWPLIGVPKALKIFGEGSVGKDTYFYEIYKKYGPVSRLRAPGKLSILAELLNYIYRVQEQYSL